jgi:protoporphyrinogen oxidase
VERVSRDAAQWVVTANGERHTYDDLVSTIPIHELLKVWRDAPREVHETAAKLRYNSLINVVLGVNEDRGYPWTALYVPDPEIVFHRLSFPRAFSEKSVPPGSFSIMAEITTNEGDGVWEMTDQQVLERVVRDLESMELLDKKTIIYRKVVRFLYGYPVYDLDYRKNVTAMREAVAATSLRLLGRFAQFDYINSDVCIERALRMAEELRP